MKSSMLNLACFKIHAKYQLPILCEAVRHIRFPPRTYVFQNNMTATLTNSFESKLFQSADCDLA